jgi:hypothetical protein
VRELNLWAQMSIATPGIEEEVEGLAVELRETFVDAIRDDPNRRLELVEGIAEHTLVLEMALIEVVPNKAWLGALGLAAYGSPNVPAGVAVGTLATFFDRGWVSIEGRLRDAITGRVLYQFADSEMGKTRILDLEVLMWYGHADEIFRDWAVQFVERINKPLNEVVADSPWFTLRPW